MQSKERVVNLAERALQLQTGLGMLSEDELALRFVERFGNDYRSVPGWGWVHFEGTHWTRDTRLRHFDDARGICRELGAVADRGAADAKRLAAAKNVAAVIQLARADQRIVILPEAFDCDRMMLNTPTGVVDLRDGSMRPHARDYLTKRTSVAPTFAVAPATWLQFLADVFGGDDDVVAFVRRLFGYVLTGETREQVVLVFHGDGDNGKSTLLDIVLGIMGDYAIKVPSAMLMAQRGERHPAGVAGLCGVRLAVANEVSEGEHWDEGRVKELSGDMKLTARFMRQDFFQFDATHKFIIAANHRPQVRTIGPRDAAPLAAGAI